MSYSSKSARGYQKGPRVQQTGRQGTGCSRQGDWRSFQKRAGKVPESAKSVGEAANTTQKQQQQSSCGYILMRNLHWRKRLLATPMSLTSMKRSKLWMETTNTFRTRF